MKQTAAIFVSSLLSAVLAIFLYQYFAEPERVVVREAIPAKYANYGDPKDQLSGIQQRKFLSSAPTNFTAAAEAVTPAVVNIKSSQGGNFDWWGQNGGIGASSGSGVLISENGYIATNNHVIQDAASVEVTLFDNRTFAAEVIGTDLSTDLALLKINSEELPHLRFGDSDQVRVGQWVLAVGNPMDLTSTVTAGIVSAKGRNIDLLRNDTQFAIESFIQTDAAVNKGNSGGALVNTQGELVGINTAIASRTGYYAGYSFAIPASIARKVMEDLLTYGEVRRGYLGVSIRPVDADLAEEEDLSILKGAFVTDINPELGAFAAGIRVGDVIVSVNGIQVNSSSELQEQVSRYRPGDRVEIALYRGEKQVSYQVELRALQTVTRAALRTTLEYRGSVFRLPTEEELNSLEVKHGVMVDQSGDKMSRNGIQKGFVITEVDGSEIHSIEDLEKALLDSGEYITIKGLYSEGMVASYSFNW